MLQAVPAPVPAGPSLNQAAVGLAGLAIAAKIAEDECDDVGVGRSIIGIITFTSAQCPRCQLGIALNRARSDQSQIVGFVV